MSRAGWWWTLLLLACGPSGDLTVAPPRHVRPISTAGVAPPREDGRLPDLAQPRRYRLRLDIDPAAPRFRGETIIDVVLPRPTRAVVLHGSELSIARAEIVVGADRVRAEASFRKAAGAKRDPEELVLVTAAELPAGDVQIHIEYTAPLTDSLRGIYRARDGAKSYVFTQFEPSDARRMFPCFDDPIYKVPFEIEVTVPKGNVVFGNAPEKNRTEEERSTVFAFAPTKPMPTYLVALAIGPLEVREGAREPVPIRVVAVEGKSKLGQIALQTAADHLELLSEYFARPYPYEKLDLVAVPNFGPGAMENAGLVTFREELLLLDSASRSAKARRDIAMILAHELAHQWFGNLVTMHWWDDLWLNEGFATYMETLLVDRWQPSMRAGLEMLAMGGWVMDIDALDAARAVRQPVSNTYQAEEAFDAITYVKGASVLRMLHRWIGDEAFKQGVRAYMSEHAWSNARAADLFRALGDASKQDVAAVATTFLDQPGVPLVRATMACEDGKKPVVKLSQQRYRARPGSDDRGVAWNIPVCLAFDNRRVCTLLTKESDTVELPAERCPEWVLPNAGYEGYYRYSLPPSDLDKLARATRQHDSGAKVGYLANLWALVQAGEVEATELLDTLRANKSERDRVVIEQVIATLHNVSDALVEDGARARFQAYVSALLLPTAKTLGFDARDGDSEDDRLLRRSVLVALATLTKEPWLIDESQKRARAYLDGKKTADPETAAVALRVMAHHGDREIRFDELAAALQKATTPARRVALVQALGSLGDPAELQKALALINDGTIRAQDAIHVMRASIDWPGSRRVFLAWLQENLATLAERFPGFGVARMLQPLRRVCDAGARAQAAQRFEPLVQDIGGLDRRLREALESASLCVNLRSRQARKVSAYLAKGKLG